MSEYLLVVEGLAESGADSAMVVSESTYRAAMFGCVFSEPVHGYVWCDTHHDWVPADEALVCERCADAAREATAWEYCPGCGEFVAGSEPCECVFLARGTIDAHGVLHTARREPLDGEHVLYDWLSWKDEPAEFPHGEFDDGAHWRLPAPVPEPGRWDWLTERGDDPDGTNEP